MKNWECILQSLQSDSLTNKLFFSSPQNTTNCFSRFYETMKKQFHYYYNVTNRTFREREVSLGALLAIVIISSRMMMMMTK